MFTKSSIESIDLEQIKQTDGGFSHSVLAHCNKLEVKRLLSEEEYKVLKEKRYSDENGWHLVYSYAYLLENKCPECNENLIISFVSSNPWTWENLCGRAGYMIECLNCECDPFFITILLS